MIAAQTTKDYCGNGNGRANIKAAQMSDLKPFPYVLP